MTKFQPRIVSCVFGVSLLVAGVTLSNSQTSQAPKAAASNASAHDNHYASVNYANAQWQKIVPELGADSPEITILRVDPKTQATHLLIRNSKKMHVPLHWHSANETHTVLKGIMVFECDGKREALGPGSFNFIPARSHHQAWLPDNGLVMITVDAAWDTNWVNGPPTKAHVGIAPPK